MSQMSGDANSMRASCEMQNRLDEVSEDVLEHFKRKCRLTHFHILAYGEVNCSVCIIFKKDKDLRKYKRNTNGRQEMLTDFMYAELERQGFGAKKDISVEFDFDSEEARKNQVPDVTKIPTNEEFARLDRISEEEWRNIDEVNDNVKQHFQRLYPLIFFSLMPQREDEFRVLFCFEKEKDLQECLNRGNLQETTDEVFLFFNKEEEGIQVSQISEALQGIIDFVYVELESADRGKRGDIKVVFEFDSDENIKANPHYHGDYFLRLR